MLRVIIILTLILSACSSNDKKADTAEGAFAIAQEYDKDERYEEAIRRYQEVKNKFPYSKYATMAELAIGDTYFKEESFAEAQVTYQNFKDLHPKHAQIDYVTFRLAMSFFNQLPSGSDRDLTLANSAILYFDEVLNRYPNSEHFKDAADKKLSALKMLADKEVYIADFYFKKKQWESSMARYEGQVSKYPNLGYDERSLSRATQCAIKLGDREKARTLLAKLKTKFPSSKEIQDLEKEIK